MGVWVWKDRVDVREVNVISEKFINFANGSNAMQYKLDEPPIKSNQLLKVR